MPAQFVCIKVIVLLIGMGSTWSSNVDPFGGTGLLVSPLTFGAWSIGGPAESVVIQVLWTAVMRDSVAMKTHGPRGKGLVAASVARMLETQRAQVGKESPPPQ